MVLFFFVPTVDNVAGNNEVFLPAHPYDLIITGKFQHVPHIIGANSAEGLLSLSGMCCTVTKYGNFSFILLYLCPCILQYHLSLGFVLNLYIKTFLQLLLFIYKYGWVFFFLKNASIFGCHKCLHIFNNLISMSTVWGCSPGQEIPHHSRKHVNQVQLLDTLLSWMNVAYTIIHVS
jgi:hypothetical protein